MRRLVIGIVIPVILFFSLYSMVIPLSADPGDTAADPIFVDLGIYNGTITQQYSSVYYEFTANENMTYNITVIPADGNNVNMEISADGDFIEGSYNLYDPDEIILNNHEGNVTINLFTLTLTGGYQLHIDLVNTTGHYSTDPVEAVLGLNYGEIHQELRSYYLSLNMIESYRYNVEILGHNLNNQTFNTYINFESGSIDPIYESKVPPYSLLLGNTTGLAMIQITGALPDTPFVINISRVEIITQTITEPQEIQQETVTLMEEQNLSSLNPFLLILSGVLITLLAILVRDKFKTQNGYNQQQYPPNQLKSQPVLAEKAWQDLNQKTIYYNGNKYTIRNCCWMTARLDEQYCGTCGRAVPDIYFDYINSK